MGGKLREWMEARGMSNTQLAHELGVTRELVWYFASGKRRTTDAFKWRFGQVFGFDEAQRIFNDAPTQGSEAQDAS